MKLNRSILSPILAYHVSVADGGLGIHDTHTSVHNNKVYAVVCALETGAGQVDDKDVETRKQVLN